MSTVKVKERLRRLLFMVPYVARHPDGVPRSELARVLGVDEATMERDLKMLEMVGPPSGDPGEFIDIYCDEDDCVRVDLAQGLTRPPRLTVPEAFALLAGARALRGSGIEPYEQAIERAAAKIRAALAEQQSLDDHEQRIFIEGQDPAGQRVLPALAAAIRGQATVEIDYYSAGSGVGSRRRVDPYALIQHLGWWYLLGRCHVHGEERLFKCGRILDCAETEERFELPADLDLERYRRDSLLIDPPEVYHVVLRLRGRAAELLAGWENGRRLDDGRLEIELDNPGLEWLCGWVLHLGPEVEVVAPEELRQRVRERAARIAAAHAPIAPAGP